MAKPSLQDIDTSDTFQIWLNSTNEIINIIRTETLTASILGDTTGSESNPLKSTLIGDFTANTVAASDLIRVDSISPNIGSSTIGISSPVTVNATVKNTATFSSSAGARTRYSGSSVSWDVGFESNAVPDFIIDSGTGTRKFALKRNGELSIVGGLNIGSNGQNKKVRLNRDLGPASHAFISRSFDGPAFTAESTGLGLTGAFESVVDNPLTYFLWCSYGAIDSFIGGIRSNSSASGILLRTGNWDAGLSDNGADFIINTGNLATEELKLTPSGQLSLSGDIRVGTSGNNKRIRLNTDLNTFPGHALISKSFNGPAITADGRGLGLAGVIESVSDNPSSYFLWCSYGSIDGTFLGGVKPNNSATGVLYQSISDYRVKRNIESIGSGSADILRKIPVRSFNFKNKSEKMTGFIAHELQEYVPEAVSGNKDEIDANGKPIYQGVDNSKLVPLLTASLQEILSKMDALEKRLEAVERN